MLGTVPILGPNSASAFGPVRPHRITSHPTSEIRCDHCARVAFEVVGNCLVVTERHDTQWHKTTISIEQLGLQWIK